MEVWEGCGGGEEEEGGGEREREGRALIGRENGVGGLVD